MYAELSVSEAEKMLLKIRKIGKYHENARFLATEIMSDLRNAERNLHVLEEDEIRRLKEKIAVIRKEVMEFKIL